MCGYEGSRACVGMRVAGHVWHLGLFKWYNLPSMIDWML